MFKMSLRGAEKFAHNHSSTAGMRQPDLRVGVRATNASVLGRILVL